MNLENSSRIRRVYRLTLKYEFCYLLNSKYQEKISLDSWSRSHSIIPNLEMKSGSYNMLFKGEMMISMVK